MDYIYQFMTFATSSPEGAIMSGMVLALLVLVLYAIYKSATKEGGTNSDRSTDGAWLLLLFLPILGIISFILAPLIWIVELFKKEKN